MLVAVVVWLDVTLVLRDVLLIEPLSQHTRDCGPRRHGRDMTLQTVSVLAALLAALLVSTIATPRGAAAHATSS